MLKLDLEYYKGIFIIRLYGTLNRKYSHKINNYIVSVIRKHCLKEVIFNLTNLTEIDNSGINALLNAKCATRCNKGHIYLCGVSKEFELKLKSLHIKTKLTEGEIIKLTKV